MKNVFQLCYIIIMQGRDLKAFLGTLGVAH